MLKVSPERRTEILRRYLAISSAARPQFGPEPTAPLAKFRQIAPRRPAFRILERHNLHDWGDQL